MGGSEQLPHGALKGVKVLDLSRILAGPTCTQLLGDLGATVIKVENPATGGDDTRQWGPPYVVDSAGKQSDLSAYFMAANRNKHSIAVDIASAEGQRTIRRLAAEADILIENFKPGGLAKYGLDYASLRDEFPGLIYCSISGYGQTGPNSHKPGYDIMAQGFGGFMSLTGEPDGEPMKAGRRHRRRDVWHVCLHRHPVRAAPPGEDRRRSADRSVACRLPDRLADQRGCRPS